jgi:hypothetical protein
VKVFSAAATVLFLLFAPPAVSADITWFAGTWKNIDPETRGVKVVEIVVDGTSVSVRWWGACRPRDCEVGPAEGAAYATRVEDDLSEKAHVLSVVYTTRWSVILLLARPDAEGQLVLEYLTRFTDGSGRSNTARKEVFRRAG